MKLERILYVSHRFHTNQLPIMKGWTERGVKVLFMAQYEGVSEVHNYADFYLMKPSFLTRIYNWAADRLYNPSKAESKKNKAYIPSRRDVRRQIKAFAPQIVIIRNMSLGNAVICSVCKKLKIEYQINYTQTPLYGNPSGKKAFSGLAYHYFPKVSFTPVLYRGEKRDNRQISDKWYYPHYYIPLVCSLSEPVEKSRDGIIRLLDVGKYRGYKNHFFLIDALADVKDRSRFRLNVIGQMENSSEREYFKKLSGYVKEKGLDNIVSLSGNVPFEEMEKVYSQADVLVLPSKSETAGMVILEAMARGLCVVSGNNCGLACYLDENNCGLVFSLRDTSELTAQLNLLADNPSLIEDFGRKSMAAVEEHYNFGRYYEGLKYLMKDFYHIDLE